VLHVVLSLVEQIQIFNRTFPKNEKNICPKKNFFIEFDQPLSANLEPFQLIIISKHVAFAVSHSYLSYSL
jgi:hypothetical protein